MTQLTQAQHWHQVNGMIPGGQITGIAANVSSPAIVATTLKNGIYRSVDSGDVWQQVLNVQDSLFALLDIDGKHLCAGGKGFTYTSADSGATWATHTFPFHIAVARLVVHPSGALIAGTGSKWDLHGGQIGHGAWLSTDSGKTWTALNTGIAKQNPLIEALAVTPLGTVLAGIYDSNAGTSGKYGIMKLDSLNGSWQRVPVSVNAPFNQSYTDQNLRIESVFNINVMDEQVVASIAGIYVNFAYAFSIQKPVEDIDTATAWTVKWIEDSIPGTGSFYEHLTNLYKDSHDTLWASVCQPGNEINNELYTGSLTTTGPWSMNMDSITQQTGRFLFAEGANGRLYSVGYYTGSLVFVRGTTATAPVAVNESTGDIQNNWLVYPNPANTFIQLYNSASPTAENMHLTLYDALGNKLLEQTNTPVIQLTTLPQGIYFVSVNNGKQQQILRFVKAD